MIIQTTGERCLRHLEGKPIGYLLGCFARAVLAMQRPNMGKGEERLFLHAMELKRRLDNRPLPLPMPDKVIKEVHEAWNQAMHSLRSQKVECPEEQVRNISLALTGDILCLGFQLTQCEQPRLMLSFDLGEQNACMQIQSGCEDNDPVRLDMVVAAAEQFSMQRVWHLVGSTEVFTPRMARATYEARH